MRIHKSAEDYLEMILRLTEEKGYARSVDIAVGLGVSKPSVSVAMKQLREGNYIVMDKDNFISLTDTGMEIAQRIYERHKVLTRVLTLIGVVARQLSLFTTAHHVDAAEALAKITVFVLQCVNCCRNTLLCGLVHEWNAVDITHMVSGFCFEYILVHL
jgi:Mn-dependent DtxR family transcriptional regulator